MKFKINIISAILLSTCGYAQQNTENYVQEKTYLAPTTNIADVHVRDVTTYFDGMGRAKQSLSLNQKDHTQANGLSHYTHFEYDQYGNQVKTYLPLPQTGVAGSFNVLYEDNPAAINNTLRQQTHAFYANEYPDNTQSGNAYPYSEVRTDDSPLRRVLEESLPGAQWKMDHNSDNDHTIKHVYSSNKGSLIGPNVNYNAPKHFSVSHPSGDYEKTALVYEGFYSEGVLSKHITKDVDWSPNQTYSNDHTRVEYKDKLGRVVLSREYNEDKPHDTYYVYDDYGNLTYVLPPLAVENLSCGTAPVIDPSDDIYMESHTFESLTEFSQTDWESIGGTGTVNIVKNYGQISLNVNLLANEPFPLKRGASFKLDHMGTFKDQELGRLEGEDYRYEFFISRNHLYVQGEGKMSQINASFSTSSEALTYNRNYPWVIMADIHEGSKEEYIERFHMESENINAVIPNDFGGQGHFNLSISADDQVALTMNFSTNVPVSLEKGAIMVLDAKRRIQDMSLGSVQGSGYKYDFEIKDMQLIVNGSGSLTNVNTILYGNQTSSSNDCIDKDVINGLVYIYHYDKRNRMIELKIPGKGWEFMVYDRYNRLRLSQDANQRLNNAWLFHKYDQQNRIVLSGLTQYNPTGNEENSGRLELVWAISQMNEYENKIPGNTSYAGKNVHYTNYSYPPVSNVQELYLVKYYDNYSVLPQPYLMGSVFGVNPLLSPKGLLTHEETKILGGTGNYWEAKTYQYDNKERLLKSVTSNTLLNDDYIEEYKYTFTGEVDQIKKIHSNPNASTPINIVIDEEFKYDYQGRMLSNSHKINGGQRQNIAYNTYNDLGKSSQIDVGGILSSSSGNYNFFGNGLQSVNHTYDIHGILTKFNNPQNLGGDVFGYAISKDFDGNIKQVNWVSSLDNQLREYSYSYDGLERMKSASFKNLAQPSNNSNYDVSNVTYDKNGNIITLNRRGQFYPTSTYSGPTTFDEIDKLSFTYIPKTNQLDRVDDGVQEQFGFVDNSSTSADYLYDRNGNMVKDLNKDITNIEYNHLNLPIRVELSGNKSVELFYNLAGDKIKQVTNFGNGPLEEIEYSNGFVYKNNTLEYFNHEQGYIEPKTGGYQYYFTSKDHLGNIRQSYSDLNGNGQIDLNSEIFNERHYYPFGMKHKGYNTSIVGRDHNFGFNGKEEVDQLGLKWLDFGARNYDVSIGRWMNVDPLSENSKKWNPYNYCYNNPINFVDPDGMQAITDDEFRVYPNGKVEQVSKEGEDVVVLVNRKGKETGEKYNVGNNVQLIKSDAKSSYLIINDQEKAKEAFKGISGHANKEFAKIDYTETGKDGSNSEKSMVFTQGMQGEIGATTMAKALDSDEKISVTSIDHSHQSGLSHPSGYEAEWGTRIKNSGNNDGLHAKEFPNNSKGEPIKRHVYDPRKKKAYRYNAQRYDEIKDY